MLRASMVRQRTLNIEIDCLNVKPATTINYLIDTTINRYRSDCIDIGQEMENWGNFLGFFQLRGVKGFEDSRIQGFKGPSVLFSWF